MKHFNDYHALARQILQLVGGPSNVISVNHCQTRLRFVLRNEALADTAALQQLDGVLTVVRRGEGMPIRRRAGFEYQHLAYLLRGRMCEPFLVKAPYRKEE